MQSVDKLLDLSASTLEKSDDVVCMAAGKVRSTSLETFVEEYNCQMSESTFNCSISCPVCVFLQEY